MYDLTGLVAKVRAQISIAMCEKQQPLIGIYESKETSERVEGKLHSHYKVCKPTQQLKNSGNRAPRN